MTLGEKANDKKEVITLKKNPIYEDGNLYIKKMIRCTVSVKSAVKLY